MLLDPSSTFESIADNVAFLRQFNEVIFLSVAVLGLVSFALIMTVVYPLFRNGEETMYFAKYYGHLGRNLHEFVMTFVTRPSYFFYSLFRPAKLAYVGALIGREQPQARVQALADGCVATGPAEDEGDRGQQSLALEPLGERAIWLRLVCAVFLRG